ncbi:MAG: PilZ domain-containing protein [Rhizobiaceae bacterium]
MPSIEEKFVPVQADDRRGVHRQRVFKGARLSFNKGYGALECVMRDLTRSGARLSFGETSAVPQEFNLLVGDDAVRQALVRWRTLTQVGVEFR